MFPLLWVGFSITIVKKISVQISRKNSWDSLKYLLRVVQFMFDRLKSPKTKKKLSGKNNLISLVTFATVGAHFAASWGK